MKTDQQPKFCVNCRWYIDGLVHDQCSNPKLAEVDLVTGKPKIQYCQSRRIVNEPCGPDAKLWEERV